MKRLALAGLLMVGALSGGCATMLTVALVSNPVAISSAIWIWLLAVGIAGAAVWSSFQVADVPRLRLWIIWGLAFAMGLVGWVMILRSNF